MSVNNQADFCWTEWNPQQLLDGDLSLVIMILNQPFLVENKHFLQSHWNSAVLRVAVDGGLHYLQEASTSVHKLVPDIICGDLDSALQENLDYFKEMGAEVIHAPDQNETDFTKALSISVKLLTEKQIQADAILVIARSGGRVDHILGNLSTLYSALEVTKIPVFLLGDKSLTWLLKQGKHKIHVSERMLKSHVGIIPLSEPCFDVSTTGMKWNLCHSHMKLGGLISICNRFDESEVTIENDRNLIWTMEVEL